MEEPLQAARAAFQRFQALAFQFRQNHATWQEDVRVGNLSRQAALIARERDILTEARAAMTAFQAANALRLDLLQDQANLGASGAQHAPPLAWGWWGAERRRHHMVLRPVFTDEQQMRWHVPTPEGTYPVTRRGGEQGVWLGADETAIEEAALLQKLAGLQITLVDFLGQPVFGPQNAG